MGEGVFEMRSARNRILYTCRLIGLDMTVMIFNTCRDRHQSATSNGVLQVSLRLSSRFNYTRVG